MITKVSARRGLSIDLTKTPGVLDQIFAWRSMSPRNRADRNFMAHIAGKPQVEPIMPQQQFTVEVRVDYSDPGKFETMKEACRKAGAHLFATAQLISDKTAPQIAIYSDDHFEGQQDINLFDTTISDGTQMLKDAGDVSEGGVSQELLDALRDGKE